MHLPNMQKMSSRFQVQAICDRVGHIATAITTQFGAAYSATDYAQVLADDEVDAVLITTRHNLHGPMVLQALRAGKNALVEKPLALKRAEVEEITQFFDGHADDAPVLLAGFNRRFSPYARRMADFTRRRSNPVIMNYRMNAGYIPLDHWVHTEEGGGRNLGEACHIYDLFTFLVGSKVVDVTARAIQPGTAHYARNDNFVATATFEDGSVGTLTYTALGARDYPKEQMELFVDGKVLTLNDYQHLYIHGASVAGLETKLVEKGHREELAAFGDAILKGGDWPIPLWHMVQAMDIAFRVEEQLV
jgi:predicted dehydrogenase